MVSFLYILLWWWLFYAFSCPRCFLGSHGLILSDVISVLHITAHSICMPGIPLSIISLLLFNICFILLLSFSFFCSLCLPSVSEARSRMAFVILLTISSTSSSPSSLSASRRFWSCSWNSGPNCECMSTMTSPVDLECSLCYSQYRHLASFSFVKLSTVKRKGEQITGMKSVKIER